MNKKIFSLVCIILYVLLAVSIHCSEQKHDQSKTSGLRSRIVRVIKKINGNNKKNVIESKPKTQLNNNNNNDYNDNKIECLDYYENFRGKRYKPVVYCCGLFTCEGGEGDEVY
ncbi:fam-c protein [Plasmodium vinckei brucechwatti]|uniref:Fam-c protein n=1 Tax=Plasmodium vinckei brucechwatti TaxID=119398 RepID=A0A6V7RUT4_PLAVN|nr:fam-c protein [Plasmodium vinckei brucechwatti]